MEEFDNSAEQSLIESLSCSVANRTIPVAVGITIMAGDGDHAAPPKKFSAILIRFQVTVKRRSVARIEMLSAGHF